MAGVVSLPQARGQADTAGIGASDQVTARLAIRDIRDIRDAGVGVGVGVGCSAAKPVGSHDEDPTATRTDQERPLMAYVGTFSSPLRDMLPTQVDLPPGNGRGIHCFEVDRATGALQPRGVFELGTSPSCLAVNAAGDRLYSANETDRIDVEQQGTVAAYAIDPQSGQLTLLNQVPSGGKGPTYVSLHPNGGHLLVANYFGGSVAVLPILEDGTLGVATCVVVDEGEIGPTTATHAPPGSFAFSGHDRTHAHMIQADPTGRFVLHVDLGLDKIFVSRFDAEGGQLLANEPASVSLPPGDGPRHFHFHPNGRWLYSVQEEGSNVVVFDFDIESGTLTARQTLSTLPPGYAGSNFCSELLVSHDGRFVYAGNRLYDSIAIFSVQDDGRLQYVGEEWTRGNYPRSFTFDPTGQYLYCCNQRADNVTQFEVDRETGRLRFTGRFTPVGNPSHVLFVDLNQPARASQGR
jgi:6-phosphogluconolactonase